jgi:7,8-dihydropterin-6-yl-methyl-4-(beta-D-ribofuranosyl)aminobenzene 5'-phosphate synthase
MKKRISRPVLAAFAFLRRRLARIRIRREARAWSGFPRPRIGETKTLEILPLFEAAARDDLQGGFGVSYLIRTDRSAILFDLGDNPSAASPSPLQRNMARLGVSMDEIDLMVISHRHPDHVGGRHWWDRRTFSMDGVSQPGLGGLPVYIPERIVYPGSHLTLAEAPTVVADGVATTGPFTFFEPFPVWEIVPHDREQALAVHVAGQGIVLIVGCGHMGLKALLDRTETVFDVPVTGIVGGLHYGRAGADVLSPEIQMLRERRLRLIALSPHDSRQAALDAFAAAFPETFRPIRAGEAIKVP